MKRCFLILLTFCAIQASYSQTEKGKRLIGGQISLYGSSNNSTSFDYKRKLLGFGISPNFGYFVADNFAIGAKIDFSMASSTEESTYTGPVIVPSGIVGYKVTSLGYGLGGFARYYTNITDKFKFYLNGSVNYTYSTAKEKNTNSNVTIRDSEANSISVGISPGLVYFVTPKIGIETSFGSIYYIYSSSKDKKSPDNKSNSNDYGIDLNLSSLYFGLNYYF